MRLPDWRERLLDLMNRTSRQAYRPGVHDCVLFAAAARLAVRGEDLLAAIDGRYSSIEEGYALAAEAGFDTPFEGVVNGLEEIPPAYAQVGDLAMLDGVDGNPAMGVVQGEAIYTVGPRGIDLVPLTAAKRAWRQ